MKFRPGYLALAPLTPLGAAVAHAVLMPKKKSAYQPQPDADRAMAYAEKLAAMIRCDTTSYANVYEPERFERFHAQLVALRFGGQGVADVGAFFVYNIDIGINMFDPCEQLILF